MKSSKIRKQRRNRNQGRLRDPQNNSRIRPLPSRESRTRDYPALNLSSLCSPHPKECWVIQHKHILPHTHTVLTHTQTIVPLGICSQFLDPKPPKVARITVRLCFLLPSLPLELSVPDAYLSKASSLMPDNRFTLWLSENCFSSSCRQVCKDVGRGERPIIVGCE